MTTIKNLFVIMLVTGLSPLIFAQKAAPPPRIAPADAKNHAGETVTVCGKVVDTQVSRYGIAGHGKPVSFDLDQPGPNPIFYFVTFGTQAEGPQEAIAAYQGKRVCVTGKVTTASAGPFILAADRSQIKTQAENKAQDK